MPVGDFTEQRRQLADRAITAATQIAEGFQYLIAAGDELARKGPDFQDADFDATANTHLTAASMNALLKQVAPALMAAADAPIAEGDMRTHRDILLAVKKARL
jgi:hypothetical protein